MRSDTRLRRATLRFNPRPSSMRGAIFALAFVDLPLPRTAVEASRAYDEDLGIAIRIATQYTINNDAEPTRMDIAYGFASLYRALCVRVSG